MPAGLQFLIRIVSKSTKANSLSVKLEKPRKIAGLFCVFQSLQFICIRLFTVSCGYVYITSNIQILAYRNMNWLVEVLSLRN